MGVVLLLSALSVIFLFSKSAEASASSLVINEIFSNPTGDENEWIEIYNPTNEDVDLSEYFLRDGAASSKPKPLADVGNILETNGYFIYESKNWLNNDSEIVFLLDKSGMIVDKIAYGDWETAVLPGNSDTSADDNAPTPSSDRSISRIPNGSDTGIDINDFRVVPVTRETENLLPMFNDQIIINEILPEPNEGTDVEFIELFNSGEKIVDLSGWQIDDAEGGSSPFTIPKGTQILAGGYQIFYHSATGISLNDSGDSARLIDPNGDARSQTAYTNSRRGEAYVYIDKKWLWTTTPTPLTANLLTIAESIADEDASVAEQTISEIKRKAVGAEVVTTGTVTVLPGALSRQYFYIEDTESGIQIYLYSGDFPVFQIGDVLRIRGELSSYYGELRIKVFSAADMDVIGHNFPPDATQISLREIYEEDVGRYVGTEGTVTSISGGAFIISGSPQLKVLIRDSAGIDKPRLKKGNLVRVTGIISSYNGGLRILPFGDSGVILLSSGQLPVTGADLWSISATMLKKPRTSCPNWPNDFMPAIFSLCLVNSVAARPLA